MGEINSSASVLFIEKDEGILNSAKEHLERKYGVYVDTSRYFSEGMKKAGRYEYDAIISRIENTDADVLALLKGRREKGFYTPFIAAFGEEGVVQENISYYGADFVIFKNSDKKQMYDELYTCIEKSVELAKIRKNLFRSRNIFPYIWDNIPNGIMVVNSDYDTIIEANSAVMRIFGIKPGKRLKYYDILKDPNISPFFLGSIKSKSSETFEMEYDFDLVRRAGCYETEKCGKIFLEVSASPFLGDNGDEYYLVYLNDITEKKSYEIELSRANKKLSLLSGITRHDVLNQISAVRLYNELIFESVKGNEEALGYIKAMDSCVERMQHQINFTRDYENLGGYMPLWQNLDNMVFRAASEVIPADIKVFRNLGGYEVYADQMLEMVFSNLFDNSLRHGENATDIVVSFYDAGSEGVIVFEDNGVGVADEIKEDIFLKGFGSNTGYGLFLIREILDFKNFSIKETGRKGEGACFEIRVPEGKWRLA